MRRLVQLPAAVLLAACGSVAHVPITAGTGPRPVLPSPGGALLPSVYLAPARGWPAGRLPLAARGSRVVAFARGLEHPRWLQVLPNGDVLVAETGAPSRPALLQGIKGWVKGRFMTITAESAPSADRITLLRDVDGDGVAELRSTLLDRGNGLHSPLGMAYVQGVLYVANTDAVVAFPYQDGQTRITDRARQVVALPAGPINQHWTRSLLASPEGTRLYVGVGSASNIGERGLEHEVGRATVWAVDPAAGTKEPVASGLRNPVGMAWEPVRGRLWVAVNERDELGGDLVPDYMTAVQPGGFYGWPFSYFGSHVDARVKPQRPELVATAIVPDYALGAHTASLGLAWAPTSGAGAAFHDGMFVAQHGSWNRKPASGFRVVFVPFADGVPAGASLDVLSGFRDEAGRAMGRPVGVAVDAGGALLVADDVGGTVWRVVGAGGSR